MSNSLTDAENAEPIQRNFLITNLLAQQRRNQKYNRKEREEHKEREFFTTRFA